MLVVNNIGVFVNPATDGLQVWMIRGQIVMAMPERCLFVGRPPDHQTHRDRQGGEPAQDHERNAETDLRAQPAGERIGDQPAGMGQRKLRRGAAEQAMEDVR